MSTTDQFVKELVRQSNKLNLDQTTRNLAKEYLDKFQESFGQNVTDKFIFK